MLFVIIGTDAKQRAQARRKIWNGQIVDLDVGTLSLEELVALSSTDSLFGEARAYRLQNIFAVGDGNGLNGEMLLEITKDLADSPHTFILEEEKLLAKPKAALEKTGAKIVELKADTKKEPFNVFAIGNALGKRDRKQLWLLLMAAFENGVAPENIAGILAWKARSMVTAAHAETEKQEWATISRNLVVMYHESHRGAGDLGLLLERFALRL